MIFSAPCAEARRIALQLSAEQRLILLINTHRPVAEERVVLRRNVEVGHRLVAADIHGADDNAAPVGRLQRLAKNRLYSSFSDGALGLSI